MAQPTPFARLVDYTDDSTNNAGGRDTVRPDKLDAEFDALVTTLSGILTNLALNQRDDGNIRDGRVKLYTLSTDVRALLATAGASFNAAGLDWLTATSYAVSDLVTQGGATYLCAIAHTAGTFSTDLSNDKWVLIANAPATFTAADVTFTPAGSIASTDVQTALEELDDDIVAAAADVAALEIGALMLSGGTMTGDLILNETPSVDLQAAPKSYVDDVINGLANLAWELQYVSSSSIKLMPRNGNRIFINGEWYTIPSTGVALANTGLSAANVYRIYAYISDANITLEASTTARATDATFGHQIKSGDATRTLVGIVYMGAGTPGTFVDSITQRFVRSYASRQRRCELYAAFSAGASIGSSPWVQLSTSAKVEFVAFSDDSVDFECGMSSYDSGGASCQFYLGCGLDSTSSPTGGITTATVPAANKYVNQKAGGNSTGLSEGYHYVTLLTGIASGTTPLVPSGGAYAWTKAELHG